MLKPEIVVVGLDPFFWILVFCYKSSCCFYMKCSVQTGDLETRCRRLLLTVCSPHMGSSCGSCCLVGLDFCPLQH